MIDTNIFISNQFYQLKEESVFKQMREICTLKFNE